MIGHYLLTLTPEQEDRVLTEPFGPVIRASGCTHCLVMRAEDVRDWRATAQGHRLTAQGHRFFQQKALKRFFGFTPGRPAEEREMDCWFVPGMRYERLCTRFGINRVNAAIRTRILTHRLWRQRTGALPVLQLSRPAEYVR